MSLQHLGKGTLRVVKNYTKGYSDTQAKVRDATSNDPWGPSGTQMNEIAQMTYNQNDFVEIMEMLDKRLNDKGKNWRHVFKALTVLDYCLHAGSENVVIYFKDNIYIIKTLKEFQYMDEYGKDQGANVRQKAKDITNLLQDESRLREERRSRAHMRDRMTGSQHGDSDPLGEESLGRPHATASRNRPMVAEDEELNKAIEASKRSLQEEQARKLEEQDLQRAIKLSEEEEAKRKKALEDANARSLFDDSQQSAPSSSNPFPLFDPSSGTNTGLQPQFAQLQPQFTMQPQFPQLQPQFTSFNPYVQLQQQQQEMQVQAQQEEWMRQQLLVQQQQQQQQMLQAQQEEWMRQQTLQFQQQQMQQQQQQQQQQLEQQQQFLRSNNPFAPVAFSPSSSQAPTPSTVASNTPGPTKVTPVKKKDDGEHAHLANILANRDDGMDTFGNQGVLRYGHTQAGLAVQQTGFNPFHQQGQSTTSGNDQPFFSI